MNEMIEQMLENILHSLAHKSFKKHEQEIKQFVDEEREDGASIDDICHWIFEAGFHEGFILHDEFNNVSGDDDDD